MNVDLLTEQLSLLNDRALVNLHDILGWTFRAGQSDGVPYSELKANLDMMAAVENALTARATVPVNA